MTRREEAGGARGLESRGDAAAAAGTRRTRRRSACRRLKMGRSGFEKGRSQAPWTECCTLIGVLRRYGRIQNLKRKTFSSIAAEQLYSSGDL